MFPLFSNVVSPRHAMPFLYTNLGNQSVAKLSPIGHRRDRFVTAKAEYRQLDIGVRASRVPVASRGAQTMRARKGKLPLYRAGKKRGAENDHNVETDRAHRR